MTTGRDFQGLDAETLAERVFAAAVRDGMEQVWPLWADGGLEVSSDLQPSGHVIAGWPVALHIADVAELRDSGPEAWLRARTTKLCSDDAPGPLHVVLMAYETGWLFDSALAAGWSPPSEGEPPPLVLATYDRWLEGDGPAGPWRWCGKADGPLFEALKSNDLAVPEPPPATLESLLEAETPRAAFEEGLAAIAAGLAAGDFYQVNLARQLQARLSPMVSSERTAFAWALFRAVRRAQAAAFGALFPFGSNDWLVSGSPECLLRWDEVTRRVSTWPIKGTRPRGENADDDAALAAELLASEKDRAEHTMIVDLMRHDLGRIAITGSVAVPDLMARLPLRTLHHLVSEVRATVAPDRDLIDVLGAIFPGGSITGAPRIAAMQAIARLEPFRRAFYCGSLGLWVPGRGAVFSILIRTSLVSGNLLRYATGGGIVADSEPGAEWDETEHKAEALRRAIAALCG